MYFISEHSTAGENGYGTLIGIHDNFLYSGNSYENGLYVRRRKVFDTRGWETYFFVDISSWSSCSCTDTVAAAYGIIGDKLFVAGYGKRNQNEDEPQLHISSIDLRTNVAIDYVMNVADSSRFRFSLCDKCCISSILPLTGNEIAIVPWGPETLWENGTDIYNSKFIVDDQTNTCTLQESAQFRMMEFGDLMNQSNVVHVGFEKVLYFKNDHLILDGPHHQKRNIVILQESDLQKCVSAGFYRNAEGLFCIAFEETIFYNQNACNIYRVDFDEDNLIANFTKVATVPHQLSPSDLRLSKFILDSRMFIWSYQQKTFTFVFGMTSLSEAAYVSASNSSSRLHHEYEVLATIEHFQFGDHAGIYRETNSLGLSQDEVKEMLGFSVPSFFPII